MKQTVVDRILKIFLAFSIAFFFYNILLYIIGSYEIDYFDGALKLLTKIYASKGLVPYKDFSVVYPPGMFLIFGKIFHYRSIIQNNFVTSIGYIFLFILSLTLIKNISKRKWSTLLALSASSLYFSIIVRLFGNSDAYSMILSILSVLVYYKSIYSKKSLYLILNFLIYFIGVWFRWDWLLIAFLLEILILILISIIPSRYFIKQNKQIRKNILKTTVSSATGFITGVFLLSYYLYSTDVIENAYTFIVSIPIQLTSSYRDLPLPFPKHPLKPEMIFYISSLLLLLIVYKSARYFLTRLRSKKVYVAELAIALLLLSFSLVFIYYALGRSDWPHFIPLWFYTGMVTIVLCLKLKLIGNKIYLLLLLSFFPLAGWYLKATKSYLPRYNHAQNVIDINIADCKNLVSKIYANSIFVGRIKYEKYLWNNEALYLTRTDIPPATSFITEEPGIHNSCKYGEKIMKELQNSKKPMLALLNKKQQEGENQFTNNMTSCGRIEYYLNENYYRALGNCVSYDSEFEVRLYE